ncbi:MAG TPA: nicotinate-nicotinamide nucleotide adenylyltransferase [Polyangiaceae bacterium]
MSPEPPAAAPSVVRVAVYGGSFDPPHVAHQAAVRLVASLEEIDRVLVLPVFEHAFDKSLASFEHRVAMCELCMSNQPNVEVSQLEATLQRPNFTLNTLQALLREHPEFRLRLVVGADVLQDAAKWHRFPEVVRLAPLLPLGRVGVPSNAAPAPVLPDVSSTEIRSVLAGRAAARLSPALRARLSQLLDPRVIEYIEAHDLYR